MVKVILVTGVSRGIGLAIVHNLCSRAGVIVVGAARTEPPLLELKKAYGDKFDYVVGDISNGAVPEELVKTAVSKHGAIDGIIMNAGILEPVQDVNHLDAEGWRRLFDINFFSNVALVGHAMPYLKKAAANLVFVSSGASVKNYHGWGAYGASKAALNHFASSVAVEEPAVRTISVAPGVVDTEMQHDIRTKFASEVPPAVLKRFTDLKKNNELLDPVVPAGIYANLVIEGIPEALNGKYLRYNDDQLKEFWA
ncbi:HDR192Cp [Eremothecium sinecaudum]|uniref:HDR192Cp n=1 Tax=Eremothecium sinecaudum TaxID=45286 RepID=A0A0X8HT28_9SACH|nr:HDR192Cp [Eremothecium sinecaudum]AMD20934.1 HDR192Cp [Eremothecium sinecaudum]